jgi:hypothetical protein
MEIVSEILIRHIAYVKEDSHLRIAVSCKFLLVAMVTELVKWIVPEIQIVPIVELVTVTELAPVLKDGMDSPAKYQIVQALPTVSVTELALPVTIPITVYATPLGLERTVLSELVQTTVTVKKTFYMR